MNLKNILKEHGYEIIQEIGMKYLILKLTDEERTKREAEKELYKYDLSGKYYVKVAEVGFNGFGNLYIILDSLGDEYFAEGDCFEVIEYDV